MLGVTRRGRGQVSARLFRDREIAAESSIWSTNVFSDDMQPPSRSIEHLWGFPLGQRLKDLRLKGHYISGKEGESRRKQLDALGFVWKPKRGRKKAPVIC